MKKTYGDIFLSITQSSSLFANTWSDGTVETQYIKKMINETEKWHIKRYEDNVRKQTDSFATIAGQSDYNIDFYASNCVLTQPFSLIDRVYYKMAGSDTQYPVRNVGPGLLQNAKANLTISSSRLYYWCVEGQLLKFYPTPSVANTNIFVVYNQLYDSLNVSTSPATESCKILEGFEHLLELKVLQRIFMQREQWDAVAQYKGEYKDLFAEYVKACLNQNTISPLVPYAGNRNYQFYQPGTLSST